MRRICPVYLRASHVCVAAWILAVVGGAIVMHRHELTPASAGNVPANWPSNGSMQFDAQRPTLIMTLNPQCPCSRASLWELSDLISHARGRLTTRILVVAPPGADEAWIHGDLWKAAQSVPDAEVSIDRDGIESLEDAAMLQAMGCAKAQGYLFARPMDAEAANRFIRTKPNPARQKLA